MLLSIAKICQDIEALVYKEGASIFGYACIKDIKNRFYLPPEALGGLDYAVSIGVGLNKDILKTNIDSPSLLYKHHYRQINAVLDRISHNLAELIISSGARALPIPASVIIDWKKDFGHLSHKEVGYLAGLGWRGKNSLLVNNRYGSALRLATVLTDLVLPASALLKENCGSCNACQAHCPARAIKDSPEEFDKSACSEKVKEFSRKIGVGICGLCLSRCP